ncbi:MAG: protease-associated domain-containing protein, partial [Planctomycetota bacterium]
MRRLIVVLTAGALMLSGCAPRGGAKTDEESDRNRDERIAKLRQYYGDIPKAVDDMLPAIRRHARALADLGPRQTGQKGCDDALAYIRKALAAAAPGRRIRDVEPRTTVTVALDRTAPDELELTEKDGRELTRIVVAGGALKPQTWPAHSLAPNCVQACATHPPAKCPDRLLGKGEALCPHCERPRRLVDLGDGSWKQTAGKDLDGAVVLLDFNSADAWARAASLGAAGAIFIAPEFTTVFQADRKYMAMLPLHVPRLYLRRDRGLALRQALSAGEAEVQVTLQNR